MKITYLTKQEYFAWADQHPVGELVDFMKAAIDALELKQGELPLGVLGYDAANDELLVLKDERYAS